MSWRRGPPSGPQGGDLLPRKWSGDRGQERHRLAGTYELRAADSRVVPGRYVVAIGESIAAELIVAIVGALAFGAVFGIAGATMLIVTYMRRKRRDGRPQENFTSPSAC